jgi:hypothetical protein
MTNEEREAVWKPCNDCCVTIMSVCHNYVDTDQCNQLPPLDERKFSYEKD